jgi:hypothetical protein
MRDAATRQGADVPVKPASQIANDADAMVREGQRQEAAQAEWLRRINGGKR